MSRNLSSPPEPESPQMLESTRRLLVLGIFYVVLPIVLGYLLFKIFPPFPWPTDDAKNLRESIPMYFFQGRIPVETSLEERLLLLVIVAGALGSYVHAATSFADYVGNRKFTSSWTWWYVLRPFIGVVLALVIYFGIRGGLLLITTNAGSSVTEAKNINPFGIAAFAALTGMFSKQATDKLNEIFSVIFKPAPGEGDEKRLDGLTSNLAISNVDPPQGPTTGGTPVTIIGTGFLDKAEVTFGGLAATSVVFQNETTITAVTPPSALTGPVAVEITNTDGKKATAATGYTYVAALTSPPGP